MPLLADLSVNTITTPKTETMTPSQSRSDEERERIAAKAEAIGFGEPWMVRIRGKSATAVAIKKNGYDHSGEIGWDYTLPDGSGNRCSPDEFADNFVPVVPLVPVLAWPWSEKVDNPRAADWQIEQWKAIAGQVAIHGPREMSAHLHEVVDRADERAHAYPVVLAELIAERARFDSKRLRA